MSETPPFTVIGGYLGAGKTTLVNHLLASAAGLRAAVLVNDFGSVNIDAELIRSHDGGTINLANGCVCCSLVNGFAAAIGEVRKRAGAFDHVVIEASGVADPAKIAQYGQMYGLPLDGIVVVADAEQVRRQATDEYVGDTVIRQFEQANLVILNKSDLVPEAHRSGLKAWLQGLAPRASLIETVGARVAPGVLLGMRDSGDASVAAGGSSESAYHGHLYQSWTLERDAPSSREDVERYATGLGEGIYRAKGFIWLAEDARRRYVYQQVGRRWSLEPGLPWEAEAPATRIVMIGRKYATTTAALGELLGAAPGRAVRVPSAGRPRAMPRPGALR